MRNIVWFSCGIASAVAAIKAKELYSNIEVIYCDTSDSEHPDNKRFIKDIEKQIDQEVLIIKSKIYSSIDDVFEKTRYMAGINGARCTVEMKKRIRFDYQQPDDNHIFGLTLDEQSRISNFTNQNPELTLDWILNRLKITKEDCYWILWDLRIKAPEMYSLGFEHNNCIGCVKSTSAKYWNLTRRHFPEVFEKRAKQSRILNVRLARLNGKRVFLDELPENVFTGKDDNFECGVLCHSE